MTSIERFIHDIDWRALPAPVQSLAKRCLLDTLGVGLAATRTELGEIAARFARRYYGPGEAGKADLLGFDGTCSPLGSALAGALLIDALDAHDGHRLTKGHAGATVIPALLAMCSALQHQGRTVSGKSFLEALVVGYEVALRTGISLHARSREYHTSGAWASVGVAAVGARLFGLDQAQTAHALGIADYYGPRSPMMRCIDFPTMVKDGAGWGALSGVSAAYLAADGFTGAPALPVTEADEQDYCERYEMLDLYFKPWPVCRWTQPAVQAAAVLREQYAFETAAITAIHVQSFSEAIRLGNTLPTNTEEAQYTLGFPLAAYLLRGQLGLEEVSTAAFSDTEIHALQARMTLSVNPNHDAAFPARRFATLEIRLADGQVLRAEDIEAGGDPETPLSDDDIEAKFIQLTQPVLSPAAQQALIESVDTLPQATSCTQLIQQVTGYPRLD